MSARTPAGPARPRGGGFSERVKQDLSRRPLGDEDEQRAELAAILRLAGSLHLHPGDDPESRLSIEVVTTSGAVARRTFALLQERYGRRPELRVRAPGGVQRQQTYGVVVTGGAPRIGRDTGLLDHDGRPLRGVPAHVVPDRRTALAYLRGAVLGAASVSAPGRSPHLEIPTGSEELAEQIASLGGQAVEGTVTAVGGDRPRVVLKSGETIGQLLAALGASGAFVAWDEQRLRRDLRNQANRLANADEANLRRSIEAAASQTRAVEAVIERVGWEALDPGLRDVALARLANPSASLSELGELCDPPVSKSSVHRRLTRLLSLSEGETDD